MIVTVPIWYVLELTPIGRTVYGTGGNPEAAGAGRGEDSPPGGGCRPGRVRPAGRVSRRVADLQHRGGRSDHRPGFLLAAFAVAFRGSTDFKAGRYKVWGTVIAVYVLATGVTGLQLSGAPVWSPELFDGAALLLEVGMASRQGGPNPLDALRRVRLRRPAPARPTVSPAGRPRRDLGTGLIPGREGFCVSRPER